jgi:hypothetical protein
MERVYPEVHTAPRRSNGRRDISEVKYLASEIEINEIRGEVEINSSE